MSITEINIFMTFVLFDQINKYQGKCIITARMPTLSPAYSFFYYLLLFIMEPINYYTMFLLIQSLQQFLQ